ARERAAQRRRAFVGPPRRPAARPSPPLALDAQERQDLLATLNSERFGSVALSNYHQKIFNEINVI
ncbi:MAG: hypothetical protein Q8K38_02400, partial [Burkholderiaceae bacterium]|nr:hypothetical protein [Burkholderiaceae bacterium]